MIHLKIFVKVVYNIVYIILNMHSHYERILWKIHSMISSRIFP